MAQNLPLFFFGKFGDPFKIHVDRFVQAVAHLLEGSALGRDIKIDADRFPIAVLAPCHTTEVTTRHP